MRFKGKTALISGAGRNIGKAIALAFAGEGADVILVARTADDVEKVAQECIGMGVQALPIAADAGKHEDVERVVQQGLQLPVLVQVLAPKGQATAEIKVPVQVLVPKEQATAEIKAPVPVLVPKEQVTAEVKAPVLVLVPKERVLAVAMATTRAVPTEQKVIAAIAPRKGVAC